MYIEYILRVKAVLGEACLTTGLKLDGGALRVRREGVSRCRQILHWTFVK